MKIGVIGYGRRMRSLLKMLSEFNSPVRVAAIADPNIDVIRADLSNSGAAVPECPSYRDAGTMLEKEKLDACMIGTRCSLHAATAVKVLERGLPLYLEKPVATNREDLARLAAAGKGRSSKVVVSFPLRVSPLVQAAAEVIASGRIGTVENATAWCEPPYGAVYFRDWYRDEGETGGLWLQKATHDFDYLSYLIGSEARQVAAMTTKRVFTGDRPARLKCRDCGDWLDCLESPLHIYYSRGETPTLQENEYWCMFAEDTGNEDAGEALVEFENGVQLSYHQNFMVRRSAGRRGARIYGYKGTIHFDWHTDEVKVFMHHAPRVDTIKIDSSALSHAGGDIVLIRSFLDVIRGDGESVSPLDAGLASVNLCLAARQSSRDRCFVDIEPVRTQR